MRPEQHTIEFPIYILRPPKYPSCFQNTLGASRKISRVIARCHEAEKFAPAVNARVVAIYGGMPKGPQVGACRAGVDILISTPGRLDDLLAGDPKRGLSPVVSLDAVTYLVLDEADQML